ncbi:hypothetical protein C8Q79DRAFT_629654 [Trametes meyenii]|nr:hypothetical protein C8Q79DRAFT_629654 [Trametes meyenii]
MPVTEIATLKLVPPFVWISPEVQSFFSAVSTQQAAWSGYPLHYFEDTFNANVYILTGWLSVPAHHEWIKSDQNQALLVRGKSLIDVVGLRHGRLQMELDEALWAIVEQWETEEDAKTGVDGVEGNTGAVVETPSWVNRITGYTSEEAFREGATRAVKGAIFLKRLSLSMAVIA